MENVNHEHADEIVLQVMLKWASDTSLVLWVPGYSSWENIRVVIRLLGLQRLQSAEQVLVKNRQCLRKISSTGGRAERQAQPP